MRRFEITRSVIVRAIHHLENPTLSAEKNTELFGKCFRTHGHHYDVQVTLTGAIDEKSGWIVNRDHVDAVLKTEIVDPFDGKDLNRIYQNTSCEAVALIFRERLMKAFTKGELVRVSIQETKKNYFEAPPASW